MKKICIALSLILSLFLFGCGNDSTEKKDNQQGNITENQDKGKDVTGDDTTEKGDSKKDVAKRLKGWDL